MEQKVTIKVSDRTYTLKAKDAEAEEVLRKAASIVNKKLENFKGSLANKSEVDILTFIALNECANDINHRKKLQDIEEEMKQLESELSGYIEKIEK